MKNQTPIIVALIALVGSLSVAYIQTGKASASNVQEIVDHLNNVVLPKLEVLIRDLEKTTQENAIKIARLEAKLEAYTTARTRHGTAPTASSLAPAIRKPRAEISIERIQTGG